MPIDPNVALAAPAMEGACRWTVDDVLLYHLALGAGSNPTDPYDLSLAYEQNLQVLPTFAAIAPIFRPSRDIPAGIAGMPGLDVPLKSMLHARQQVILRRPIAPEGGATVAKQIVELQDKGSAAIVVTETTGEDPRGESLFLSRSSVFVRGAGGFGGQRGESPDVTAPSRRPEIVIERETSTQQALLYRLCGDRNPLHADPAVAEAAGFDRPILHGLATYGIACHEIVRHCLSGDVSRVAAFDARFLGVIYPGETLQIAVWDDEDGDIVFNAAARDRDDRLALVGHLCVSPYHDHP